MSFIIRRPTYRSWNYKKCNILDTPKELRMAWPSNGILKNYHYEGKFVLTKANTKQLQAIYPGYCFTYLENILGLPDIGTPKIDFFGKEDM